MILVRPGAERGRTLTDWLDSAHSFSFGEYSDPRWPGFGALRVLNEDHVIPGAGFPRHGHRDMEILTWVLAGELEHRDSLGNGSRVRRGELQRMSAGRGILHSESNPARDAALHLLQIWIEPRSPGGPPSYAQRSFADSELAGRLRLVASGDAAEAERSDALTLGADARVFVARLAPGEPGAPGELGQAVQVAVAAGRRAWVQVAVGSVDLDQQRLDQGDAAGLVGPTELRLAARAASEVLVFEVA